MNSILAPGPRSAQAGSFCNFCGADLRLAVLFRLTLDQGSGQSKYYCAHCADKLVRCATCGTKLGERPQARIFMLPGDEPHIFCENCWQRPHCQACNRPVGATLFERLDGRVLCASCHATAIYSEAAANQLYKQVVQTLIATLKLDLSVGAFFHLVSREQMAEVRGAKPNVSDGLGADFVGLFVHRGRMRAIYVEYGLPRIMFCEVVAHEYAHVWQAENCPFLSDPMVREGFAEWATYKLLQAWGASKRIERLTRRQDFYGDGLRLMLKHEQRGGVAAVMEAVRRDL